MLTLSVASFIALAFSALVGAQDTNVTDVKKAFDDALLTTRLNLNFNPKALLQVTYTQNGAPVTLTAGKPIPRAATATQPTFRLTSDNITSIGRGPFVIAFVDPDAPTPQNPSYGGVRHYLGANFALQDGSDALKSTSNAITNYFQPTPGVGSPAHRYTFLLYNQPATFNSQTVVTPSTSIAPFNVTQFAERVGLGVPVAGTFMLVQQP